MKPGMALSVLAAVLILTGAPRGAAAQGTKQTVRFVPDVLGQFSALTQRADAMGFELYGPDPSQCRHMQSIIRVDAADGTPISWSVAARRTQERIRSAKAAANTRTSTSSEWARGTRTVSACAAIG